MTEGVDFAFSFFEPRELLERAQGVTVVGGQPSSYETNVVVRGNNLNAVFFDDQFKLCLLALFFVSVSGVELLLFNNEEAAIVLLILAVASMFWVGWRSFTHEE